MEFTSYLNMCNIAKRWATWQPINQSMFIPNCTSLRVGLQSIIEYNFKYLCTACGRHPRSFDL